MSTTPVRKMDMPPLCLLLDGLDEQHPGENVPISALLPERLPNNVVVSVATRPNPDRFPECGVDHQLNEDPDEICSAVRDFDNLTSGAGMQSSPWRLALETLEEAVHRFRPDWQQERQRVLRQYSSSR